MSHKECFCRKFVVAVDSGYVEGVKEVVLLSITSVAFAVSEILYKLLTLRYTSCVKKLYKKCRNRVNLHRRKIRIR